MMNNSVAADSDGWEMVPAAAAAQAELYGTASTTTTTANPTDLPESETIPKQARASTATETESPLQNDHFMRIDHHHHNDDDDSTVAESTSSVNQEVVFNDEDRMLNRRSDDCMVVDEDSEIVEELAATALDHREPPPQEDGVRKRINKQPHSYSTLWSIKYIFSVSGRLRKFLLEAGNCALINRGRNANGILSVALAAAVMGLIVLGRAWQQLRSQNRNLRQQLHATEKKFAQLLLQMKESLAKARRIPVILTYPSASSSLAQIIPHDHF